MRRREGTGELRKQVFVLSGNKVEGGENRLRLGFWRWKCDACERAFKGIFGSDWSPNKEMEEGRGREEERARRREGERQLTDGFIVC